MLKNKNLNENEFMKDNNTPTNFIETVNGVSFTMVAISGNTFTMGNESLDSDSSPEHLVTLSSYYIGETQVTQALWEAIIGKNPSKFNDCPQCPVEMVSWNDAQEFIQKINQITGKNYRLPTEAEWEYAARGGENYTYAGSNDIDEVAWSEEKGGWNTKPVKQKKPNGYNLYDMNGNVWEWCQDCYSSNYYKKKPITNPTGPEKGSTRSMRGGSWYSTDTSCEIGYRGNSSPKKQGNDIGFRLAISIEMNTEKAKNENKKYTEKELYSIDSSSFLDFNFSTKLNPKKDVKLLIKHNHSLSNLMYASYVYLDKINPGYINEAMKTTDIAPLYKNISIEAQVYKEYGEFSEEYESNYKEIEDLDWSTLLLFAQDGKASWFEVDEIQLIILRMLEGIRLKEMGDKYTEEIDVSIKKAVEGGKFDKLFIANFVKASQLIMG